MSTTDFPHEIADHAGILPAPQDGSLASELRARRARIASERAPVLLLDVPGYDGRLIVRYRYPDAGYQPLVKAIERAQSSKDKDAALYANCDLLIAACDTLLGRDSQGRAVDLLADGVIGELEDVQAPLRFGRQLAALLAIEVPEEVRSPARFVTRAVFSPRATSSGVYDGDLALMRQGGTVLDWLSAEEREVSEQFSGE